MNARGAKQYGLGTAAPRQKTKKSREFPPRLKTKKYNDSLLR